MKTVILPVNKGKSSSLLVAPSVKVGDQVLVEAHAGIEVKDGDEKYVIVGEANILAIVEE